MCLCGEQTLDNHNHRDIRERRARTEKSNSRHHPRFEFLQRLTAAVYAGRVVQSIPSLIFGAQSAVWQSAARATEGVLVIRLDKLRTF